MQITKCTRVIKRTFLINRANTYVYIVLRLYHSWNLKRFNMQSLIPLKFHKHWHSMVSVTVLAAILYQFFPVCMSVWPYVHPPGLTLISTSLWYRHTLSWKCAFIKKENIPCFHVVSWIILSFVHMFKCPNHNIVFRMYKINIVAF